MQYLTYVLLLAGMLTPPIADAKPAEATPLEPRPMVAATPGSTAEAATWRIQGSLKSTLRAWAQRKGWPMPHFLTNADWVVDVPGTVTGSIEEALKALADGFSQSPSRPRIEVTGNDVILVTEADAE
jgi:hypothetical protein